MNDILLLILSLSLSGTVIAGLCFAVKAIWKKKLSKSVLYYLWLIALVRLVLPFSFEGALLNRIYEGDLKEPASAVSSYEPVSAVASQQTTFSVSAESKTNPVQITETVSVPEIVTANAPTVASVMTPIMTETNATTAKPFDFATLTLWIWLTGFAIFCTFTLTSYGMFTAKLKKANQPADETVLEIGKQLECKIKIYRNPFAKTPMLIGLLQPTIILPDVQYTNDEIKGALIHELTHKTRHDLLYKWFVLFVNAVHWFNPVVWLVRREVSRACELSCDEAVIMNLQADQKQTYGETLINLAAAHRYPAGVIATTLCEEKRTLKERLSAIMTYQKKGFWNKVLSCVLILTIAVSGTLLGACGKIATSLPSYLVGKSSVYPKTLNIIAPYAFSTADAENAQQQKQQWLDEMTGRYGTKFNITSLTLVNGSNTDSDALNQANSILNGNEEFSGMVYINGIDDLKTAVDNGTILPLDEYLADNDLWNSLPDDMKTAFMYQGHIYAIPTRISRSISIRFIDNDALSQTGTTVTDLESLKKFSDSYTKSTGYSALYSCYLYNLTDILNAFGLYCDDSLNSAFSYDPTEDCFVDFLTKGAAVDALEYLRGLYMTNALAITQSIDDPRLSFEEGMSATYLGGTNKENCTFSLTLNSSYPRVLNNMVSGYVMAKGTEQPKETINLFINMLFGSQENYLDCWLGSSDNYVVNSDGTITVKKVQNADGSFVYPCLPNLTGGLTDVFPYSDAQILYSENNQTLQNESYVSLNDLLQKNIAVKIPISYSLINSPTFFTSKRDITYLYRNFINNAITDTKYTVQQVVDQYRLDMLNMGGNQMLDEMNAAIGKQTAYYYG